MLRHLHVLDARSMMSSVALPLCLLLSACGGGGGSGVASIPPPPPAPTPTPGPTPTPSPTPTVTSIKVQTTWLDSPATRPGTYGLIGLVNSTSNGTTTKSLFADAGEFQLIISKVDGQLTYMLEAPPGFLPASLTKTYFPDVTESWDFNPGGPNYRYDNPYEDYAQFFGQNLKEYEIYSDGSEKLREDYDYDRASRQNAIIDLPNGQRDSESLTFDVGLSYVAMGEWSWGTVSTDVNGAAAPTGDKSSIYFVYGDRTPGSGIPVTGTATYDARTLGQLPFTLTADFRQRSISTEISQPSLFDVSGSSPFSNDGSFIIPLSGTAGSQSASGTMDGAFFGPAAEQIGGVFSVESQGTVLMQDAFVGQQQGTH